MKKTVIVILTMAVVLLTNSPGAAQLSNGTFDADLSTWTTAPVNTDCVIWSNQAAVLLNPFDFVNWPFDPCDPFVADSFAFLQDVPDPVAPAVYENYLSSLTQQWTLPLTANELTFDVAMEIYNVDLIGETDTLNVYLSWGADYSQFELIYSLKSTDLFYNNQDYVVWEDYTDFNTWLYTLHAIYHAPITVNVADLAGQPIRLEFLLYNDVFDSTRTAVTVDNVTVSQLGDIKPPAVHPGELMELWPPNHKYRTFHLSDIVASVVDEEDGELDVDLAGTILSIYSDEPEDADGVGDGKTIDDIVITGNSSFKVRAERQGSGNGRIYGVTFEVVDSAGNGTVATVYLGVPHDKSGKDPIVDDGPDAGYVVY